MEKGDEQSTLEQQKNPNDRGGFLLSIPNELLFAIAAKLDPKSFGNLCMTCTTVQQLLRSTDTLWQNGALDSSKALHCIHSGHNVFVTGPAGSGKSYTLNRLYQLAPEWKIHQNDISMVSTTLLSATLLPDGTTIHQLAGLGFDAEGMTIPDFKKHIRAKAKKEFFLETVRRWKTMKILVIDEVSMLGKRTLERVNAAAQVFRDNDAPMGGVQVVACGDFYQLPPVNDQFAFQSQVWKSLAFKHVELKTSMRHAEDNRFFNLLQRVRKGTPSVEDIQLLKDRLARRTEEEVKKSGAVIPTYIFPVNQYVIQHNQERLMKLGKPDKTIKAMDALVRRVMVTHEDRTRSVSYLPCKAQEWNRLENAIERVRTKLEARVPSQLSLVPNAQYIVTRNIPAWHGGQDGLRLFNGMQCVYLSKMTMKYLSETGKYVEARVPECSVFYVQVQGNYFLERYQVPLKLGYATSTHAAQGMTLESAAVDVGSGIFSPGQLYVALSRVKSLSGLHLLGFDERKICVSKHVAEFYGDAPMNPHPTLTTNNKRKREQDDDDRSQHAVVHKRQWLLDAFSLT